MTFARPIMALLAASAASAAAFGPAVPLSSARPVQSSQVAKTSHMLRAPRAMPAHRRVASGVKGVVMSWESDGYLIAPSIVNADLVSCGPRPLACLLEQTLRVRGTQPRSSPFPRRELNAGAGA
jgi:hypothetical protein